MSEVERKPDIGQANSSTNDTIASQTESLGSDNVRNAGNSIATGGEWRQVASRHQQTGSPTPPMDAPSSQYHQQPITSVPVREQQPARRTNCGNCQGECLSRWTSILRVPDCQIN